MIIEKLETPGLAHYSYIVADPKSRDALVVDPRRDVDDYLELAGQHGFHISGVTETHIHADYVTGVRELAARTGAPVYLSAQGAYEFEHQPIADGDVIMAGEGRLRVMHTPGHTPEHICMAALDPDTAQPTALFTGDTLFFGSVGRPDLLGAGQARDLAGQLFESLHQRLMRLPDDVEILPAHGAGSMCGAAIAHRERSTIGLERRENPLLQVPTKEAFVERVLSDLPTVPDYWALMKKVNAQGPSHVDARSLTALPPTAFAELGSEVLVIDTRPPTDYATGHLPGSYNLGLGYNFVLWAGWIIPPSRALGIVAETPDLAREAARQLRRIGFDDLRGYLRGGLMEWRAHGLAVERMPQMTARELASALKAHQAPDVLDVRSHAEWRAGHVDGATHIPLAELPHRLSEVPPGSLACICGGGYRSSIAASIIRSSGRSDVTNVVGGMRALVQAVI
jgi:hydroxyacylglutathione hydrolase